MGKTQLIFLHYLHPIITHYSFDEMEYYSAKRSEVTKILEDTWNGLTKELWFQIVVIFHMKSIFRFCVLYENWNNIFVSLQLKEQLSSLMVLGNPTSLISCKEGSYDFK